VPNKNKPKSEKQGFVDITVVKEGFINVFKHYFLSKSHHFRNH